jgi:DNA polymerase-3 subunit alpha
LRGNYTTLEVNYYHNENFIVKPDGFDIPFKAEQVHGISTKRAMDEGHELGKVLEVFIKDLSNTSLLVGHNIEFDINIIGAEFIRQNLDTEQFLNTAKLDTGISSTEYCALQGGIGGKLKMPTLAELHKKLFDRNFEDAHDASYDVAATARSFFGLINKKVVKPFDALAPEEITYEEPNLDAANFTKREKKKVAGYSLTEEATELSDKPFVHLHAHSQYSVLQATPDVKSFVSKAKALKMPAVALTDLGNMYGAFKFVREAINHEIKPIVGCELYVAEDRLKLKFTKDNPDKRFNQVLIAKNKDGYHNLAKLSSLGFTEGLYGIYPRIDKALIKEYHKDLIAFTGSLAGEVPYLILHVGEKQAEEAFKWWHDLFQDDFYIELNRHGIPEEDRVNETLLRFAEKYGVKYFAANEAFYTDKAEANAHDVLLCIKEGEFKSTPIGYGRGHRLGMSNNEYYFKSQEEMKSIFRDLPAALETIGEIVDKIEPYTLERNVALPKFDIPKEFESEDDYLRYLTYEGAKKRYSDLTPAIIERLDFELDTIKKTGYPGYFLIVQDFTSKAREIGVSGRTWTGICSGLRCSLLHRNYQCRSR